MSDAENTQQDVIMKLYTLYLKDLQSVGSRHENMRKYYLTLISTIFTILSMGGSKLIFTLASRFILLVSIFGALLCLLWLMNMHSYSTLFKAKFTVLDDLEKAFPKQPFTMEKAESEKPTINHHSVVIFDMLIAAVFFCLFIALPFLTVAV